MFVNVFLTTWIGDGFGKYVRSDDVDDDYACNDNKTGQDLLINKKDLIFSLKLGENRRDYFYKFFVPLALAS